MSNSKRILAVVFLLLLIASIFALRFSRLRGKAVKFVKSAMVSSSNLTISWDANPPGEDVISYKIYERIGDDYRLLGQANFSTSHTLKDVRPGTHAYAVTAVNSKGESARSAEVSHTIR